MRGSMHTYSATSDGLEGTLVEVEATLQSSLPQIIVTGLPGDVVKESRERVRASLESLGFQVPTGKILVHLSPATAKKQGSQFDLSIALLCLQAESALRGSPLKEFAFFGELSLDGRLKPIRGILPMVDACEKSPHIRSVIIPQGNEKDLKFFRSAKIKKAGHLAEVIDFVRGKNALPKIHYQPLVAKTEVATPQFDSIIGQEHAKHALAVAIAGRHHLLMIGPAGVGKSLLASSSPEMLPPLSEEETIELKKIYAASAQDFDFETRPFRSPHHSISTNALLGGGKGVVTPGEVSLSHHGILFLDEFPEYRRDAIEGLREPLESGEIHVHRVGTAKILPSHFTLIAAMNPCPCGKGMGKNSRCTCRPDKALAYRRRISGPILDRMGLCIALSSPKESRPVTSQITGKILKEKIQKALERQRVRFQSKCFRNGNFFRIEAFPDFRIEGEAKVVLESLTREHEMSYRRISQLQKVARTIADMDGSECIQDKHLWEAWGYQIPDFSFRNNL